MSRPILLDTCAALWMSDPGKLNPAAEAELQAAQRGELQAFVSPITAWEVGMLVAKGRLALSSAPLHWFQALQEDGLGLAPLNADLLVASSFLPGRLHGDPADRVLAATARSLGCRLMTRDRPLLAYAAAGHIQALPC